MQGLRKPAADRVAGSGSDRPPAAPVERVSAGLTALLDGIPEDRSRAILDLGTASGPSLSVYGRFARWIRFADVLTPAASPDRWDEALRNVPANPARAYDLVFAWDVLERLPPEARPEMMRRLADVAAEDARLFLVLESPDVTTYDLPRFTVVGRERLRTEPSGEFRPPRPRIAPAEVKELFEPFRVRQGFTTRVGVREYVAGR